MTQPLVGHRVLEFGDGYSSSYAGMMLADLGAEVIRLYRTKGQSKKPFAAAFDRGKRCVVLDPTEEGGRKIARRLALEADILIEGFDNDVMNGMGLGSRELRAENPRLLYLSMPGFSSADNKRRNLPGEEGSVLAAAGVFSDRGTNHRLRGHGPSYVAMPLASAYAAGLAVTAVLSALVARRTSGRGEHVEVSLHAALLEALAYNSLVVEDLPERYNEYRDRELQRRLQAGMPLNLSQEHLNELLDPLYGPNLCADGRYYYLAASGNRILTRRALQAMGLWDDMLSWGVPQTNPYRDLPNLASADVGTIFGYQTLSPDWFDKVASAVREKFLQKTSREWEAVFQRAAVPGSQVRTTAEWLRDDHLAAAGLIGLADDPLCGPRPVPGPLFWFKCGQPVEVAPRTIETVMPGWQSSPLAEPTVKAPDDSLPLSGLTILDLTAVIAGPTIGATLQRFGASVIKLDPVQPSFDPLITVLLSFVGGRDKQSLLLDLHTDEGYAAFADLLRKVDIVTYNGSDDQLARLRLGPDLLKEINSRIVLCQLSAYGGPTQGPRSGHYGYDETLQAASGIMVRSGGSLKTPEEHAYYGTLDVMSGFLGAAAAIAGILARDGGVGPTWVETSLAASAHLSQASFIFGDGEPRKQATGPRAVGEGKYHRMYAAKDGWLFLSIPTALQPRIVPRLCACGAEHPAESDLERAFLTKTVSHWITCLRPLGAIIQPLEDMATLRQNYLREAGRLLPSDLDMPALFLRHKDHPCKRTVDVAAPVAVRYDSTELRLPGLPSKYGSDTRRLLAGIGRSDAEIDAMIAIGAAADSWPEHETFLPG